MAGVVDEARGAVCDALPPLDAVVLPEPSAEGEDDLGGAVVVNAAQCMCLTGGERGVKFYEACRLGSGRDQDCVSRQMF